MKYLIDTHALLWTIVETNRLSDRARQVIEERKNEICVSTISLWEIALKHSIGKLDLENLNIEKIPGYIEKMGMIIIELSAQEAIECMRLPMRSDHKDPFDRILIWQAISRKMIFISKDIKIRGYEKEGLKHLW